MKIKKYLILLIALMSCKESIVDSNEYYYKFNSSNPNCIEKFDSQYEVKIDTSKFQSFVKFDITTNNNSAKYVDFRWQSRDTFYVFINGVNAGPLPPTNLSSVLFDGKTETTFGFHRSSIGDTIRVLATFIDSKTLPHKLSEKNIYFFVKMK